MLSHSEYTVADLDEAARVRLLYGLIVPRPIAVVTSISPQGFANIAPFSFFNAIGEDPLALSFSITSPKIDGAEKDTLRNIRPVTEGGSGEFVVNVATANYVAQIERCGVALAFGESEFEFAGLTPTPSLIVGPPRIAEAKACFECRTLQIVEVGRSRLVIGEVVHISIEEELFDAHGRVDPVRLDPIGRLAGPVFCRLGERFEF